MICTIKRPVINFDGNGLRAVSAKGQYWRNGETIDIFLYPTMTKYQYELEKCLDLWFKNTSLDYSLTLNPDYSDVRIDFVRGSGSWSYVGTDALLIPKHKPTLQLGWEGLDVIYHELGHMLGLLHEHQNPEGGLKWDEQVVIKELSGPPNNWPESQIRSNVLDKIDPSTVNATVFDPDSVMLYFFPDDWTIDAKGTKANSEPSTQDLAHISALYPKPVSEAVKDLVRNFPRKMNRLNKKQLVYLADILEINNLERTKKELIDIFRRV